MRESFDGRLAGALRKALVNNGINPNGAELNAITASMSGFFVSEVEGTVSDPAELAKVQKDIKAKQPKAEPVKPSVNRPAILSVMPPGGQVGSTITIKGENFGASGEVQFSGKAAVVATWTNNVVVTIVPKDATTGMLVVTADGLSSSASFTVLP